MNPKADEFHAEVYKAAAQERVLAARELYERRQYVMAHYAGGLSVECILWAYRLLINREFSSRHDLQELNREARFTTRVVGPRASAARKALKFVAFQWSNSHRFRSARAFQAYLKQSKLDRGIKGDFVKENTRLVIDYATQLVEIGVQLWTSF